MSRGFFRVSVFAVAVCFGCINGFAQEVEAFDEEAFEENDELKEQALEDSFYETMAKLEEASPRQVSRELKVLATKGQAKAQHAIGAFYRNGFGVKQNLKRSNYWFEISAQQGYPIAMLAYGEACFSGDGMTVDYQQAKEMLEPVAQRTWAFDIAVEDYAMVRGARSRAAYLLGVMYAEGHGVEEDDTKAIELMHRASGLGDVWSTLYLAVEYARGKMVERDVKESKRLFELVDLQTFDSVRRSYQASMVEGLDSVILEEIEEEAEELSESVTQMIFASQTEFAKGALVKGSEEYDPELAANLLNIAANSGYKEAQYLLGYMHATGLAGEIDYSMAFELFEKASEQGWTLADYNFGVMLLKGYGCEVDESRGRKLVDAAAQSGVYLAQLVLDGDREAAFVSNKEDLALCKAADKDDLRAAYSMVLRKKVGWLVPVEDDPKKILKVFRKGAESGYARSQYAYAEYFYWGIVKEKSYARAFNYFSQSAAQGHAPSYFRLGYMYDKGLSVYKDYKKSAEWYEKAVAFGDPWAANNLGSFYNNGYLGERDYEKSMELYLLSVERGNSLACYNIGLAFENGRGREIDLVKAVEWYRKAADLGDKEAAQKLVKFHRNGKIENSDDSDLAYWLEKAAELGDRFAMKEVAARYFRGVGLPKSQLKAMFWIVRFLNTGRGSRDYSERLLYADILLDEGWIGHDANEGYRMIKYLVKEDYLEARFRYAEIHRKEMVSRADPLFAFKEYKKLYKEGKKGLLKKSRTAEAAYMLSRLYAEGKGVKQSDKLRAQWMKTAADIGLEKAKYLYAGYEISGMGVEVNLESAVAQLELLAEKGYKQAVVKLGRMIADGIISRDGREEIIDEVKLVAATGSERAKKVLRDLGIEVEDDYEKSENIEEEQGYRGPAVIG